MVNFKLERFSAVSETGSCSMDYATWEESAHCGHAHKTIEAAKKCLDIKQRCFCNHGRPAGSPCRHCNGYAKSTYSSALWCNGAIHNQHGERCR